MLSNTHIKGQTLLLILLSMSVVLVVVLSIVARSITDVAISSREEEAIRAFSAAEAGIEQALIIGVGTSNVSLGNASFSSSVTETGRGESFFNYPSPIYSGESATFWFVDHDEDGNATCSDAESNCFTGTSMTVCWGEPGTVINDSKAPAIETSVVYAVIAGDYATLRIFRDTADPYLGRMSSNSFGGVTSSAGNCVIDGERYQFSKTIILSALPHALNNLQYAKVRMFYNDTKAHKVGVQVVGGTLPLQGTKIESSGQAGDANRKVEVFQMIGETPGVFDNVLFSGGGISQ